MPFLIDGYNLLWMLRTHEDEDPPTDLQLCRCIGRYLRGIGEKGEIIFDGIGPPDKTGFNDIRNLDVIYTGKRTDADTVIARKVNASTAPRQLTVVSSDREVRFAAKSRKSESVKSEDFWSQVQKEMTRKKHPPEPDFKRRSLTESETKQWMDFFGIDEEE